MYGLVLSFVKISLSSYSRCEVAKELVRECGSKLVAMTNGSQPSVLANPDHVRYHTLTLCHLITHHHFSVASQPL